MHPEPSEVPLEATLPRIIWLYWQQGLEEAPWLVQRCAESWLRHNPNWDVKRLDADSIRRYLGEDAPTINSQALGLAHQSDLIRLQLLQRYGGVWADPTTLCRRPLDQWLGSCCRSGFFAFHRPGRDRLIANWFLVSSPNSAITQALLERLYSYWSSGPNPSSQHQPAWLLKLMSAVLNRSSWTARWWLHPILTEKLGIRPYFVFHYLFADLVASDRACRTIWENTPQCSARPARLIERLGWGTTLNWALQQKIDCCNAPMFKLTWKIDPASEQPGTVLHYVLNRERTTTDAA